MNMPYVSVIIPAFNEEKVIDECLHSLTRQSILDFEVLVVNDCSTDSTAQHVQRFVETFSETFFLKQYGKVGPGRARNLAAKDARGQIYAFIDADCIATPTWLENLLKGFTDECVASTGGPHIAPPTSNAFQLKLEQFFKWLAPLLGYYKPHAHQIRPTHHNPACNAAYRAHVFHRVGGFHEDFWPGEDVAIDFEVRDLGHQITYNPHALVFHHRSENIFEFRKFMNTYGRAQAKLLRVYGVRRSVQWVFLGFVIGTLVMLLASAFNRNWLMTALLSVSILSACFFRPSSESYFSIVANSFEWMIGFCKGLIENRSGSERARPKPL